MKKIFTIAALAAVAVFAGSCDTERDDVVRKGGITASASLQPMESTKAVGQNSYNIFWETDDRFAVLDNADKKLIFQITEGAGTATGTFLHEGADVLASPFVAYFPTSVVTDSKALVWPATQADVENITNVPMMADPSTAEEDVDFAFKHLGAVLQLALTARNGEINVKQIDITADQGLSGAFTVVDGAAVISSTGTGITTGDISASNIKLSSTVSYLNFAIPSGTFTNSVITITGASGQTYSIPAGDLTLQRAMVNQVTLAVDARSTAICEMDVNGHIVTVDLADDVIAHDVLVDAYVDGESAIVSAYSKSGMRLKCTMPGGEYCTSQSKTDNFAYNFIISDISENTAATIGYAGAAFISTSVDPVNAGSVKVEGEQFEGETVILTATPNEGYGFACWKDQDGAILSASEEYSFRPSYEENITAVFEKLCSLEVYVSPSFAGDVSAYESYYAKGTSITLTTTRRDNSEFNGWKDKEGNKLTDGDTSTYTFTIESDTVLIADYTVHYGPNDLVDGVFTVAADNGYGKPKKVRFSRGNLWCGINEDNNTVTFNFEDSQMAFHPQSGGPYDAEHISHFFWSKDAAVAYQSKYDDAQASESDVFFTNTADFSVNGVSAWFTLSGEEWEYLLGRSAERTGKYKTEVTVDGMKGLVIAPDNFSDTIYAKYTASEWQSAEREYGLVFLPAAGFRGSTNDGEYIGNTGVAGLYWSSTPINYAGSYQLSFSPGLFNPSLGRYRNFGCAIRLVTEVSSL